MNNKVLFISIDGMTDSLGQSQVLPYLTGLSEQGFEIAIISCEKEKNLQINKSVIVEIVTRFKIEWIYSIYENKIPFFSQRQNVIHLKHLADNFLKKQNNPVILHCRGSIPGLVALSLLKKYHTKFIYDMRGFWADERLDGNIWSLKNPLHKAIYSYFKRKEKQMLLKADFIVTLTQAAKKIIPTLIDNKATQIEVIPCCADINHFTIYSDEKKTAAKNELHLPIKAFVVGYLGSIGTWYMLDEMLDFFVELKKIKNNAILFFVTNDDAQQIIDAVSKKNISMEFVVIKSAKRNQVPAYISTFDVGLFFIKPLFSKQGSSPTKLAELLACGIPVITNTGVGDVDKIITDNNCGILVREFNSASYNRAIANLDSIITKPQQHFRDVVLTNFSLKKGRTAYAKIYSYLSETK